MPTGTDAVLVSAPSVIEKISRWLSGVLTASSVFPSGVSATGLTAPLSKVMKSTAIVGTAVNTRLNSSAEQAEDRRVSDIIFLTLANIAGMVLPLFLTASKRDRSDEQLTLSLCNHNTISGLALTMHVSRYFTLRRFVSEAHGRPSY